MSLKKIKKTYTMALPTSVWNAEPRPRLAPLPIITEVWAKSWCHVVMFRQDTARRGRYHLLMPHLERHQAMPWDQGAGTAKAVISCMVSPTTPWNNAGLLFNSFWHKREAATYNHRCLRLKVWNPVNISFFTTETAITKTIGLSIIYKYTLISFYILLAHEKPPHL